MSDIVIRVESLSKQYRLGQIGGTTLREDVQRWWARLRRQPDPTLKVTEVNVRDRRTTGVSEPPEVAVNVGGTRRRRDPGPPATDHRPLTTGQQAVDSRSRTADSGLSGRGSARSDYVWALKDVSFEVGCGEVLGIIGRNGAGKSTLLKILSRITAPTTGRVKVKGRIASLLEVGTGMHPELTGRENIYLNGAILGMTKSEITRKLDEIVDFSGCERYIDTPVKRYSSGMMVRLGFAVAAHLEPEILIVDEVLAVGDAEFQKKCLGKMSEVASGGRTVLFVSHNMAAVTQLTSRSMVLGDGEVDYMGQTDEAVVRYMRSEPTPEQRGRRPVSSCRPGSVVVIDSRVMFSEVGMSDATPAEIPVGGTIELDLVLNAVQPMESLLFGFTLRDETQVPVLSGYSTPFCLSSPGRHRMFLRVPSLTLAPGVYDVCVSVQTGGLRDSKYAFAVVDGAAQFHVSHAMADGRVLGVWHRDWGRLIHQGAVASFAAE